MAGAKATSLRVLFAAIGLASLPPSAAHAQAEPWIGQWASPRCGTDAVKIVLNRSRFDLSDFETMCDVRRVEMRGAIYNFDVICGGEGKPKRGSLSALVDGDTLEFVAQRGFEFSPTRFTRCKTPGKKSNSDAAPRSFALAAIIRGSFVP